MLKAISVSLAMEQALAPKFKFVPKHSDNDPTMQEDPVTGDITIAIKGLKQAQSDKAKAVIEHEMSELIAKVCQNSDVIKAMANDDIPAELLQDVYITRVIKEYLPNESDEDVEAIRQQVAAVMAMSSVGNGKSLLDDTAQSADITTKSTDVGANHFIGLVRKFININELSVDLIDSINPFGHAYQVLSKGLTADVLQKVHGVAKTQRIQMTETEALALWPRIEVFAKDNGRPPSFESPNHLERRLGEALEWLKNKKRESLKQGTA